MSRRAEILTLEVDVGTVHHIGSVDELITRASSHQLDFRITQDHPPSVGEHTNTHGDPEKTYRQDTEPVLCQV